MRLPPTFVKALLDRLQFAGIHAFSVALLHACNAERSQPPGQARALGWHRRDLIRPNGLTGPLPQHSTVRRTFQKFCRRAVHSLSSSGSVSSPTRCCGLSPPSRSESIRTVNPPEVAAAVAKRRRRKSGSRTPERSRL